jgi:hypothetical protein
MSLSALLLAASISLGLERRSEFGVSPRIVEATLSCLTELPSDLKEFLSNGGLDVDSHPAKVTRAEIPIIFQKCFPMISLSQKDDLCMMP